MDDTKKPEVVKYLLYLTPKQFAALNRLKASRNRKLKKNDAYLTSIKKLIGEAIDKLIDETTIRRNRKSKPRNIELKSASEQLTPAELMSQAQTHIGE